MASRSFKQASYLTSAPRRSPRQRPAFTRTSSGSSTLSTASEDSFTSTLRALCTNDSKQKQNDEPGNGPSSEKLHSTPGRKRSQPIPIGMRSSNERVHTPLSARGDLPGGYFPNHEDCSPKPSYRPHPFTFPKPSSPLESPGNMSASSSVLSSPSSDTPKGSAMLSPTFLSPAVPETLLIPMGKYHPSNYKSPTNTEVSTPTPTSNGPTSAPLPPTNLTIPTIASNKRHKDSRAGHERKSSDIKRKIQQYQRDMIAQARHGARSSAAGKTLRVSKPKSPQLMPAGSPGPITPFELEESADEGYIAAGMRARGNSLVGDGLERERDGRDGMRGAVGAQLLGFKE